MTKEILAIDPGKQIGWAILEFGGKCVDKGVVSLSDFPDFLSTLSGRSFHCIVYEAYRIFGHRAVQQSGSSVEAAQTIGMVKAYGRMAEIRTLEQQPGARLAGAKFVQFTVRKGHMDDDISAWLHGVAYLKSINQLTTGLERRLQNGD